LCAGIEKISGRKPFYVGKPSPWIIRAALNKMQAHSEETVIVGLKGIIEGLFDTGTTLITACLLAMISMFAPVVSNLPLDYYALL
ncbi:UMP phosphatase, partial [Salmonella enterica subsp. enterica serovar Kentucky]|nr:UMP phosphatase [Salmonella enterica subsp. enterica serovar Kentucky]